MARRKLAVGEVGNITTARIKHRQFEARARVGTLSGESKQVKARGATAETARKKLAQVARNAAYLGGTTPIDGSTTLYDLVESLFAQMEKLGDVRPQTLRTYKTILPVLKGEHGDRKISNLPLVECTTSMISGWIEEVAQRAPSVGKRAKVVLKSAFELAIRQGIDLWKTNPAASAKLPTVGAHAAVQLTKLDLVGIRKAVADWQTDRKSTPLKLMIELLIATGMRPGEMLALRWEDIDLASNPARITVCGTIVADSNGKVVRQVLPKTEKSNRVLAVPSWVKVQLLEWRLLATDLRVFSTRAGSWYSLANVRRAFREAVEDTPYSGWQLKNFRSGVATHLENSLGVEIAARQLGHESPAITNRHYVKHADVAGDFTEVLEMLAPDQSVP